MNVGRERRDLVSVRTHIPLHSTSSAPIQLASFFSRIPWEKLHERKKFKVATYPPVKKYGKTSTAFPRWNNGELWAQREFRIS